MGWEGRGKGRKGNGRGMGENGRGGGGPVGKRPWDRGIPVLLFPHFEPWLHLSS